MPVLPVILFSIVFFLLYFFLLLDFQCGIQPSAVASSAFLAFTASPMTLGLRNDFFDFLADGIVIAIAHRQNHVVEAFQSALGAVCQCVGYAVCEELRNLRTCYTCTL